MKTIGEKVRAARLERNWSQERLAEAAGTSQTTVDNIERGATRRSRYLIDVLRVLDISSDSLDLPSTTPPVSRIVRDVIAEDERRLPIYASAEGGEGQMILTWQPIDYMASPEPLRNVSGAFGMYVVGSSMSPRYAHGDLALIHPHRPVRPGDDVMFARVEDGTTYCMLKRLRGMTRTVWRLEQFNPPEGEPAEFDVPRVDWPQAFFVIGRFNG